jgi:hypothetical protein
MNNFILADEYVTDTVGLIIYLENRQLGIYSQQIFNSAKVGKTSIYVPSIVLAEIMYLSENEENYCNLVGSFSAISTISKLQRASYKF